MKLVWDSTFVLSSLPLPPLLRFGFEFSSFGVFCVWRRQPFEFVFCWTLCDDSDASSLVPNPLKSRVLTNWSFLCSWENPNPLWYFLEFSRFFNLLGEISWGYVHGTGVKISSKFRWIWTSFARDLPFEALIAGCLGATGLTGLCNRSDQSGNSKFHPDRSVLAIRLVWLSRAAVWGVFPCCFRFSS